MLYIPKTAIVVMLAALAGASGCDDPATGKPKAEVTSATAAPASATAAGSTKPAAEASAAAYQLVADESKIEFVGSKVTGKHDGGFKKFQGTAEVSGGTPEASSVEVEIDATSVWSDDEKLTGHLKSADFFDVEKHPTAKFVSTGIEKGASGDATHTVAGNLTLRGETKAIKFPATITVEGDTAKVKAEFSINRKDFGVEYAGMPDDLIRDDVVIKLDLALKKKS
jgi:polyisoprenoid-binding protein YceI